MSLSRSIKRNKDIEPYFLDFCEWINITERLPEGEELPEEYYLSLHKLTELITKIYNIKIEVETENFKKMLIEAIEYYYKKYSIEEIIKMNEIRRSFAGKKIKTVFIDELDKKILTCTKCKSKRNVLNFETTPLDVKEHFKANKDEVDYFLHCPNCNLYSMIYKEGVIPL